MSLISIPKRITKGEELVVVPRKEYEKLLEFPKKKRLDRGLEKALEDIKRGKVIGPFTNAQKLICSLESEE